MELFETIIKFFLLSIIGAIISVLTGGLVVLVIQRFNPRLKDVRGLFRLALAYVSGLIVLPTFYAAYYTNGKTVLWMALILWLSALAYLRPNKQVYISVYRYAPHLLFSFVLCFSVVVFIVFDFGSKHIFRPKHIENYYYSLNLLEGMKLSNVESLESNLMDHTFLSPSYYPYHYYDIWTVGFYASLLDVTNANSFEVVCPTLLYFGIVVVIAVIVNLLLSNFMCSLLIGFLFLFYNPIDLFFILGMEGYSEGTIEKVYSGISKLFEHEINFKVFPRFLLIVLSLLMYRLKSYATAWFLLIILIVFNVNNLGIVLALMASVIIFYIYSRKYNLVSLKVTLFVLLFGAAVVYLVLNFGVYVSNTKNDIGAYFPRTELSFTHVLFNSFTNTVVLIFILVLFSLHVILISLRTSHVSIQRIGWFFFLTIIALCAGAFGTFFGMKYFIFEDAGQFLSSPSSLYKVLIFILLIDLASISFIPYLLFLGSLLFHLYLAIAKLSGESYFFDTDYHKHILSEKTINKIGASFVMVKPIWKINSSTSSVSLLNTGEDVYYKKITILNTVGFLNQFSQDYIAAIPLIDLHVPIDTLNPREVAIRKHFIFYNYFQQKKMENPYITEREAQIMFMRERNIDWVFHDSTFTWPQEWEQYVRKKIVDPNTRATMVYLKPWN